MPEEDAEEAESEEEEQGETIEDLFGGEQTGDDGEEVADGDEPDEERGDEGDDGGDDAAEESDDGEQVEDDADSDEGVEGDAESNGDDGDGDDGAGASDDDDPAGVIEGGASGVDVDLAAVEDRTTPPRRVEANVEKGRLSTGIDALDAYLDGGIPAGRILSFVAGADTQSELLVKHLAAQHDCLYLSTLRPKWEVEEEVRDYIQKHAESTGGTSVFIEQLTPDSRLDSARRYVENLEGRSVVVIDSANELESQEKERYVYFLDELKRKLWETGSVGLLYCIDEGELPEGRDVTLRRADLIWQLRPSEEAGGLHHDLVISKFRSGRALTEPLLLSLTDEVRVESD